MATYKLRTRNTDADQWTDRYEIEDPLGVLDITSLTASATQKLVTDGENQVECLTTIGTRKFLIKKL